MAAKKKTPTNAQIAKALWGDVKGDEALSDAAVRATDCRAGCGNKAQMVRNGRAMCVPCAFGKRGR